MTQWTETTWSGLANYQCSACPFATIDADAMARHQMGAHGHRARTVARNLGALEGVTFASDAAAERATAAGLTAGDFDFEPSGQTGYTTKDVERAARDLTTTTEE